MMLPLHPEDARDEAAFERSQPRATVSLEAASRALDEIEANTRREAIADERAKVVRYLRSFSAGYNLASSIENGHHAQPGREQRGGTSAPAPHCDNGTARLEAFAS